MRPVVRTMDKPQGPVKKVFMDEPGESFHGGDCYDNDSAVSYKFHLSCTFCKRTQRISML